MFSIPRLSTYNKKEKEMTIEPIKEKLDDKIAKLNSSRVYKKVTPRGDLSWYIKWASSVLLIIAMVLTSANIHPWNLYPAIVGMTGWLIVGLLWHDRALIVLNAISVAIYLTGIVNSWFGGRKRFVVFWRFFFVLLNFFLEFYLEV